jgi:hypothetical protein
MTAAAAAVAVRMRWHWLLVGALVASAPQVAALVVAADRLDAGAIAVACVFVCIYLAAAVGEQVAFDGDGLEELPTLFSFASIGVVWLAATQLFEDGAGAALLVAAAAFAAVSVAVWLRDERELGTLLGAIALATAAVGVADLLTGATVAYVFAAESVLLAFAARRTREPRLQLAALCYLALASLHVLAIDAPPDALFVAARHPGRGAATLAAAAVAAFAFARMTGGRWSDAGDGGLLGFLSPVVASLRSSQSELRIAATGFGVLLAIDAVSLVVLELAEAAWSDKGIDVAFDRGHLVLTVLWATAGLATVVAGTPRRVPMATALGFTWLAVTAAKVALYDALHLGGWAFAGSFLAAAAALLLAGFFREVLDDRRLGIESAASIVASALYAAASLSPVESRRDVGLGLLAIALVYAPLAAGVFARARLRDLATLLWSIGAVFAAVAAPVLLEGTWLTLAWAGGAAAFATAAVVAREQRFLAGAAAYVVLATCSALSQAPPWHLVVARQHPAEGVVDLLLVATAACVFAWAFERIRDVMLWIACGVVVYGASLGILELSIRLSDASVATGFQRGHSGVSALWGALGLTLLYVGLTRRRRALRIGGLTLFGVGLAKLFLYDLAQLSSMTRALSFLAVGAVLLLGGFFMQRLTAERGPTSTAAS